LITFNKMLTPSAEELSQIQDGSAGAVQLNTTLASIREFLDSQGVGDVEIIDPRASLRAVLAIRALADVIIDLQNRKTPTSGFVAPGVAEVN
jgi:hypothetical protein